MPTATRNRFRVAPGFATLLLIAAVLVGCARPAPAPTQVAVVATEIATEAPTQAPPTATAIPPTSTPKPTETLAPTDTPAPTATATATEAPTAVVSIDATHCIDCHTNQEILQQLAREETPAEKLSEGEG